MERKLSEVREHALCERDCSVVGIRHSLCEEEKELCGMRESIPEVREGAP